MRTNPKNALLICSYSSRGGSHTPIYRVNLALYDLAQVQMELQLANMFGSPCFLMDPAGICKEICPGSKGDDSSCQTLNAEEVWANTAQSNLLFEVGWWEHIVDDDYDYDYHD